MRRAPHGRARRRGPFPRRSGIPRRPELHSPSRSRDRRVFPSSSTAGSRRTPPSLRHPNAFRWSCCLTAPGAPRSTFPGSESGSRPAATSWPVSPTTGTPSRPTTSSPKASTCGGSAPRTCGACSTRCSPTASSGPASTRRGSRPRASRSEVRASRCSRGRASISTPTSRGARVTRRSLRAAARPRSRWRCSIARWTGKHRRPGPPSPAPGSATSIRGSAPSTRWRRRWAVPSRPPAWRRSRSRSVSWWGPKICWPRRIRTLDISPTTSPARRFGSSPASATSPSCPRCGWLGHRVLGELCTEDPSTPRGDVHRDIARDVERFLMDALAPPLALIRNSAFESSPRGGGEGAAVSWLAAYGRVRCAHACARCPYRADASGGCALLRLRPPRHLRSRVAMPDRG